RAERGDRDVELAQRHRERRAGTPRPQALPVELRQADLGPQKSALVRLPTPRLTALGVHQPQIEPVTTGSGLEQQVHVTRRDQVHPPAQVTSHSASLTGVWFSGSQVDLALEMMGSSGRGRAVHVTHERIALTSPKNFPLN